MENLLIWGYEIERQIQEISNILQINAIADCCAQDICRKTILLFLVLQLFGRYGPNKYYPGKEENAVTVKVR